MAESHVRYDGSTEAVNTENGVHVGLYELVAQLAREHGHTVTDSDTLLRVPSHSDLAGGYVIPDFVTDGTGVSGAIRDGTHGLDFKLRETRRGEAAATDKSHFTAVAVTENWDFAEIVTHLLETGQFSVAAQEIAEIARDDVNPADVVCWAVATYLKGVLAERVLTTTDDYSKAGVSNDQHGDDVYVLDGTSGAQELAQVKCVTVDKQAEGHVYYQFAHGRMYYGDDYKDVISAVAADSDRVGDTRRKGNDIPKTVIGRTHTSYKSNQRPHVKYEAATYRYIHW